MTFREARTKVFEILKENGVNLPRKPMRFTSFSPKTGRVLFCSDMNYAKQIRSYRDIHKLLNNLIRDYLASRRLESQIAKD